MRCECCDKLLSDSEATARFIDEDSTAPPRYVGMCTTCRGFLPPSVRIAVRHDFEDLNEDDFPFDSYSEDTDYDYED